MSWSAERYLKFEDERNRPIRDLLAQLPIPASKVNTAADIGCGPGNSTALLRQHFPHAVVMGVDNSANMIAAARQRLPDICFELDDIANWRHPGPFEVILANAVLQWLPDHASLLPKLVAKLTPGGVLAVQMPDNLDEPAHRLMREVAAREPWRKQLASATKARSEQHAAPWYYRELRAICSQVDVWLTTYYHPLAGGADAVVEWFRGTGLRPFLDSLDDTQKAVFLSQYRVAIEAAYPALADGTVLLPFPRLFIVARRPERN